MQAAQIKGLDRARTVLDAADSLLSSAMTTKNPESVPAAVRHLASATHTTIVLLRNDGTSAYSDRRTIDRIKAFTAIPEDWSASIHSPDLFLWPPSGLPGSLSREIDRVFALPSSRLLTDRRGQASPLALKGGYAVWARAVPNRPSCASCHGFDKEVLGHWVAISRVDGAYARRGPVLWGFWPLPAINQRFLFFTTLGLAVFSIFLVSVLETWTISRAYRAFKSSLKPAGKNEGSGKDETAGPAETSRSSDLESVPHGDWGELHRRIEGLDHQVLALIDEIPRPGVQPQRAPEQTLSVSTTLPELLSEWSDRFEMSLQELSAHPVCLTDPVLSRFLEKAREFREQAVSFVDIASSEPEEKTAGVLKAPFFEALTEDQKEWTDRLRAVLGHLHAEIRAMEGVARSGKSRTGSSAPPDEESPPLPGGTPRKG
jgi:hypothetical protein